MAHQHHLLAAPRTDQLTVFRSLRPPVYRGIETAMQTEEWIEKVDELLVGMRCTANIAVSCVITLLEGYARDWWRTVMHSTYLGRHISTILWGEFTDAFLEHFIPTTERDELQERFLHLRQGDRSVAQYQREFTHLARFAGILALTDRDRANRFFRGLRDNLRQPLIMAAQSSYHSIAAHATALESDQLAILRQRKRPAESSTTVIAARERSAPASHRRFRGRHQNGGRNRQQPRQGQERRQPQPQPPTPQPIVQAPPQGVPFAGNCFLCHQPGHIRAHCPQANGRGGHAADQRGRGRGRGGRQGYPGRRDQHQEHRAAPQQAYAIEVPQDQAPQNVVIGAVPTNAHVRF